jgi:hypothetical protein
VRFDPDGVHDIIKNLTPPPALPPTEEATPATEPEEPPEKGPPVSPELLKAWFEVYRRAYIGAADTEANAVASARGMFPGKSVSRERVRELRGAQKRGRKATDSAN